MKKKRMIAVLLSFVLCVCSPVVYGSDDKEPKAAEQINVSADGTVQVKLSSTTNKFGRIMYVFAPGVDLSDGLTDENLAKAVKMELIKGDTCTFKLAVNAPYGIYKIAFSEDGVEKAEPFVYTDPDVEKEVKKAFNTPGMDVDYIISKLEQYNNIAYIINLPTEPNEKSAVAQIMLNVISGDAIESVDDIVKKYNTSLEIYALKTADADKTKEILSKNVAGWGLEITSNEDYTKYETENAERFVKLRNSSELNSIKAVSDILDVAVALTGFQNAPRSGKVSKLQQYNDIFKLDFSGDFQKTDVITMNRELDGQTVESVLDVQKIFATAVKNSIPKPNGGPSGGGGRGYVSVVTPENVVLSPETIENLAGNELLKFSDLADFSWAKDEIEYLAYKGIMTGDGIDKFRPGDAITREEFVKILVLGFSLESRDREVTFTDVDSDAWYYESLAVAFNKGIINGLSENRFGIGEKLTRQDAAVILYRLLNSEEYTWEAQRENLLFEDMRDISEYALIAVDALYKVGIINGSDDNKFMPNGYLTRAEAAKMLYNTMDKLVLIDGWK